MRAGRWPAIMATAVARLQNGVFAFSPAKLWPLLPIEEAKARMISVSLCAPLLVVKPASPALVRLKFHCAPGTERLRLRRGFRILRQESLPKKIMALASTLS